MVEIDVNPPELLIILWLKVLEQVETAGEKTQLRPSLLSFLLSIPALPN